MIRTIKRFPRPDGSVCTVDTTSGQRVVTYTRADGAPLAPTSPAILAAAQPQKPPRRLAAKKRLGPAVRTVCAHLGAATGELFPPADGLGDRIERGLSALGLTKAKWAKVKHAAKLSKDPQDCSGCTWRKEVANAAGRLFGFGKKSRAIGQLLDLEAGQQTPIHACAVHGACLPLARGQSIDDAPHRCAGCADRKPIVQLQPPSAPPDEL